MAMFIRRKADKILFAVVAAGLFLAASIGSNFRVRTDMPREFVDRLNVPPMRDGAAEEKIARAYWDCVVARIQWKYSYQQNLPQDPPPEFAVSVRELSGTGDATTRARYWRKLRDVWYQPDIWTKQYDWDFKWINNPVATAGSWWQEQVRRLSP
jgi:hypothetical protein